jgi:hypothetical protein
MHPRLNLLAIHVSHLVDLQNGKYAGDDEEYIIFREMEARAYSKSSISKFKFKGMRGMRNVSDLRPKPNAILTGSSANDNERSVHCESEFCFDSRYRSGLNSNGDGKWRSSWHMPQMLGQMTLPSGM